MSGSRILIVGGTDPVYRETVAAELRFLGHNVEIVGFDEADDIDVKSLDFKISGTLEIREEDREKVLALFAALEIPSCPELVTESVEAGIKRGKKGKFKKDWMR